MFSNWEAVQSLGYNNLFMWYFIKYLMDIHECSKVSDSEAFLTIRSELIWHIEEACLSNKWMKETNTCMPFTILQGLHFKRQLRM